MNRMITSVLAFGAGMAALTMAQRNNMMKPRQMRKLGKRITKMF